MMNFSYEMMNVSYEMTNVSYEMMDFSYEKSVLSYESFLLNDERMNGIVRWSETARETQSLPKREFSFASTERKRSGAFLFRGQNRQFWHGGDDLIAHIQRIEERAFFRVVGCLIELSLKDRPISLGGFG
jgi:hypothetical protein